MQIIIDPKVKESFPDLHVLTVIIKDVNVKIEDPLLEALKEEVIRETRAKYDIDSLRDLPVFREYRTFFWKIKVDPTKNRPAAEALIRRVLLGSSLPKINTLVDAYNLASIKSEVAIAAFDMDKIVGSLIMRYAIKGEEFYGIGMKKPALLQGGEIIISDEEKIVAIYPYRDAESSKVTERTRSVLLVFCGVPGIDQDKLYEAMEITYEIVTRFCGGMVG